MKKNLILSCSILLFACTLLTSCKKESTPITISSTNADDLQVGNNSSYKLTHNGWAYYWGWDFHYNDKGLADEWKIDFGNGYFWNFKMKYDKFHKLIEADGYDPNDDLILITTFKYSGNQIISQTWTDIFFGTTFEYLFTHNGKGQIIRIDANPLDIHIFLTYDNLGNCTSTNLYLGDDIYFSDIYEFNVQARNPLLTVSGVDFLFPYFGVGYFNKLWFSRNLSIVYDSDGNPFVINDFSASKKDFKIGRQNFPISINYYDTVAKIPFPFTFGYSGKGNANNDLPASPEEANWNAGNNKNARPKKPLLTLASGKTIKEQLQELRKQYAK
jgi:hypothetical protein